MAKMSRKDIRQVANLSRLEMTDAELDKFSEQLGDILDYASMLDELDTKNVEPTSHVMPLKNVFREDKVKPSYPTEELLESAPDAVGDYFCVPKIIDDGEGH